MQLYQLHQLRMPHWPSMAFGQGSQKEQLIKKIGKHKSARFLSLKQVVRSKAGATAQLILLWIVTKWRPDIMMKKSSCDIFSNVTKWQHCLQSTDEIVEILYSCFRKWASSVHEQASVYPSCTHLPSSQKLILSVRTGNEKFVMKLSGTALLASQSYSKKERTLTLRSLFCEMMYMKHMWHLCLNLFHHVPSSSSPNHVACLHIGSVQFTTFLEIFSYLFFIPFCKAQMYCIFNNCDYHSM